ncbi:MAG: hypothetical protein R3C68_12475 [Myxococcota bacterium]
MCGSIPAQSKFSITTAIRNKRRWTEKIKLAIPDHPLRHGYAGTRWLHLLHTIKKIHV